MSSRFERERAVKSARLQMTGGGLISAAAVFEALSGNPAWQSGLTGAVGLYFLIAGYLRSRKIGD